MNQTPALRFTIYLSHYKWKVSNYNLVGKKLQYFTKGKLQYAAITRLSQFSLCVLKTNTFGAQDRNGKWNEKVIILFDMGFKMIDKIEFNKILSNCPSLKK